MVKCLSCFAFAAMTLTVGYLDGSVPWLSVGFCLSVSAGYWFRRATEH